MPRKPRNALRTLGKILIVIGVALDLVFRFIPDSEFNDGLALLSFLPLAMILGGAFLFFRGRQLADQALAPEIIGDENPDVLYLRSFGSDPSVAGQVFSSMLTARLVSGMATEEEQLRDALAPFGDMVAIGQPGETLPKPGAARMYATDDEWKALVRRQMEVARLVIIRAANSAGVLWELRTAAECLEPQTLLVLVLGMKKKDYAEFVEHADSVLPAPLPGLDEVRYGLGVRPGFVRFSETWETEFLRLRVPYLRSSVYKPLRRQTRFTLRPVFEAYGLDWELPPVSGLTLSALGVLGLLGLLFLAAIISAL